MRFLWLLFVLIIITSCTGNSDSEALRTDSIVNKDSVEVNETNPLQKTQISFAGCYIKIIKRDTMVLHLRQNGDSISGKMNFDNYEKDSSSGEVKGVADGDIIKLWYNFQSEGTHSVAELFFKKENGSLIRGIADVNSKADTSYFTDNSAITYPASQTFSKVDCSNVPSKYL